jgi:anti-sigma regulatory factor (Ser/Thr protein kinase)
MTEAELVLPADASAPSKARELLATVLADHADSERLARGQLALSEVVSNAVRHGGNGRSGSIRVLIERSDGVVSVTVTQPGPIPERPSIVEMPEPWSTGGYGLAIVDTVADRWGVRVDPPSVWFELRL